MCFNAKIAQVKLKMIYIILGFDIGISAYACLSATDFFEERCDTVH